MIKLTSYYATPPGYEQRRARALTAAKVLRDGSLRRGSTALQRLACRTLMRQAAIKWRNGFATGE